MWVGERIGSVDCVGLFFLGKVLDPTRQADFMAMMMLGLCRYKYVVLMLNSS